MPHSRLTHSHAAPWGSLGRSLVLSVAFVISVVPSAYAQTRLRFGPRAEPDAPASEPRPDVRDTLSMSSTEAEQQGDATRPWYERLRFSGDFRSRYEGFYQESTQTRNRVRLRFRMRVDTEVNRDTQFHLQLASGDPGTPVSTNQTFTEFFLPKPFSLDRAYISYNPKAASAMTLGLGRFAMPQSVTQMVFDEDLNLEGGWEQVSWAPRKGMQVTLIGLQTAVNERSSATDSYMMGGYGEVRFPFGSHSLQVSAADYGWGQPDQIAVGSVKGPLESILTNDLLRNAAGEVVGYRSGFNVVDVIAEATIRTRRAPLRLLANFAHNTRAATDRDSGFWIEAEYGRARASKTWSTGYTYGWVEQDVTPSAFVFSDMPGTNLRLHMLEGSYVPLAGLSLDVTLHISKTLQPATPSAVTHWLSRLHVAAVVRF